eukprot:TRINITY_DN5482_c0_g1_i6.p1 TRINITY_DN5482_c0_g1~~TRINITY_DN5482_c0_g1_i6.p1  ORF type:complete len:304 (+),score=47.69 TRINITY_DN5482_c0_g1_i6:114-1025(+)
MLNNMMGHRPTVSVHLHFWSTAGHFQGVVKDRLHSRQAVKKLAPPSEGIPTSQKSRAAGQCASAFLIGLLTSRCCCRRHLVRRNVASDTVEVETSNLEELDRTDPGRSALRGEWAGPGEIIFEEQSDLSGLVRVYASPSSSSGSWRRLRFNDSTEQSVVLLDDQAGPVQSALAFGYLKTLAALGTATAQALGRSPPLQVLVVGVGLGALPNWFASEMEADVDAVELDRSVIRAAVASNGLPESSISDLNGAAAAAADASIRPRNETEDVVDSGTGDAVRAGRLRVYCCDGAEFIAESARLGFQ